MSPARAGPGNQGPCDLGILPLKPERRTPRVFPHQWHLAELATCEVELRIPLLAPVSEFS